MEVVSRSVEKYHSSTAGKTEGWKKLFYRFSLDKEKKPCDMLTLQALGVEILARQQKDVKALAQKQSKLDATRTVRQKKFQRQQK